MIYTPSTYLVIEWLNNNTATSINFFLIEIHAYKIGDSLYAPKFEVVEKPNGFIKSAKTQSGSGELNKSQSERLEFWNRFNEILVDRGKPFNVRKGNCKVGPLKGTDVFCGCRLRKRKTRKVLDIVELSRSANIEKL